MTFEQILAQARSVRSSLGTDDMPPVALVERMGRLKAIVNLPFDREQALDMIVRTRIGFAAPAVFGCERGTEAAARGDSKCFRIRASPRHNSTF
jgi:hypothetical protein